MPTLLVVDDDPLMTRILHQVFAEPDVAVLTAASAAEGLQVVERQRPDVVLLDINLPDQSGLDTFQQLHDLDPRIPVIFITAGGTTETAITAMKLGAFDYLLKPLDLTHLRELVERAFEIGRLMRTPVMVGEEEPSALSADVLVGRCPAMQEVYKGIGRVAGQDVTVLILGASGTGKELVARAIYHHSRRASGPFLAINCAAIPETLLESELFGHEKGAFTGADRKRIGKFEQCHGGTLFLDEIGDMSPLTQTKVLRVLQEQCFERVGGNETIRTDVRIIAATNRDLPALVAANQFRSDLYYRLSVFTIRLPALAERRDDLPLLVHHFLRRFSKELGKEVFRASPETLLILERYPWPGNIRQLQSVLKQAILQATGPILLPDFLPDWLEVAEEIHTPPGEVPDLARYVHERLQAGSHNLYDETVAQVQRFLLPQVLGFTGGNQAHAARILGISRNSFSSKLRSLGLSIKKLPGADGKHSA